MTDFTDFLRRARWKSYQRVRRQEKLGKCLMLLYTRAKQEPVEEFNADHAKEDHFMHMDKEGKNRGVQYGETYTPITVERTEPGTTQCLPSQDLSN
jgi:hypothetical protein